MNILLIPAASSRLIYWTTKANGRAVEPDSMSVVATNDETGEAWRLANEAQWNSVTQRVELLVEPSDFPATDVGKRIKLVFSWTYQGMGTSEERLYSVVPSSAGSTVLFTSLEPEAQAVIRKVQEHFSDLQDSMEGGPYLNDVARFFGDDRYALLLEQAIQHVNGKGMTQKSYTLDSYPYSDPLASGVIVTALMLKVVDHLILSYTEDPDHSSVQGPILERRDYMERWGTVKTNLETDLKDQILALDRQLMDGFHMSLIMSTRQFPFGYADRVRPSIPPWWRGW